MSSGHQVPKSTGFAEPQQLLSAVRKQLPTRLPQLDQRTLDKLKKQALRKAADLQQQASQAAKDGLAEARLIIASGNAKEAGSRLGAAARRASASQGMLYVARLLVCTYFMSSVYDRYSSWQFMQQPEVLERVKRWPQHYPVVGFPYLSVAVLLPCVLLAALGVRVMFTASVLVAWEFLDSLNLVWTQLMMLVFNGVKPNELVVKRLAIMGCTVLVLAHSMKEQRAQITSYAGLLLSGDSRRRQPSRAKSLVLLMGRLSMALLFVYVGITQLERVIARDFILFNHLPHSELWQRDGHDNNWLLLEFVLALPFAVGYKTRAVSRLLAAVLAAEAVTCWPWWASWPTQSYAAHVRLHFVTNLGVAGGLLLLASFGAGRFTVDALLAAKKKE